MDFSTYTANLSNIFSNNKLDETRSLTVSETDNTLSVANTEFITNAKKNSAVPFSNSNINFDYFCSNFSLNNSFGYIYNKPKAITSLNMSSDGKYQVVTYDYNFSNYPLSISNDYGITWKDIVLVNSETYWGATDIAISSTGQYITFVVPEYYFTLDNTQYYSKSFAYRSNDYGNTWYIIQIIPTNEWLQSVDMSSDGKYQTITIDNYRREDELQGGNKCKIYFSVDYGVSWKIYIFNEYLYLNKVCVSSSGQYQTCAATIEDMNGNEVEDYIYNSINYGFTWTKNLSSPKKLWVYVAMSSSGQYQTALAKNDYVYVSNDYGITWRSITDIGNYNWSNVSISETGQYQILTTGSYSTEYDSYLYYSSDYGATWDYSTEILYYDTDGAYGGTYSRVKISSNGSYILVSDYYDGLFKCVNTINVPTSLTNITFNNLNVTENIYANNLVVNGANTDISVNNLFVYDTLGFKSGVSNLSNFIILNMTLKYTGLSLAKNSAVILPSQSTYINYNIYDDLFGTSSDVYFNSQPVLIVTHSDITSTNTNISIVDINICPINVTKDYFQLSIFNNFNSTQTGNLTGITVQVLVIGY